MTPPTVDSYTYQASNVGGGEQGIGDTQCKKVFSSIDYLMMNPERRSHAQFPGPALGFPPTNFRVFRDFLESHYPSCAFLCACSMHKATQETLEYQHFEDQTIVKSVN